MDKQLLALLMVNDSMYQNQYMVAILVISNQMGPTLLQVTRPLNETTGAPDYAAINAQYGIKNQSSEIFNNGDGTSNYNSTSHSPAIPSADDNNVPAKGSVSDSSNLAVVDYSGDDATRSNSAASAASAADVTNSDDES